MPRTIKSPTFSLNEHLKAIRLSHKIMRENEYKYSVELCPTFVNGDYTTLYIRPWGYHEIVFYASGSMSRIIKTLEKLNINKPTFDKMLKEKESDDDLPF